MKSGKLVLGILAGLATGAVLGILFAPDKGRKTRRKLIGGAKGLADDLTKKIKDEVSALRSKATDLENLAVEKVSDITNTVKQKVDTLKNSN